MSVNRARVHAHLKMAQEELQDSSRIHEPFSLRLGYQAVWSMAQTALEMLDALPSEEFCRNAEGPGREVSPVSLDVQARLQQRQRRSSSPETSAGEAPGITGGPRTPQPGPKEAPDGC